MPLPDTHKDAVLAMLMLAEDLAYRSPIAPLGGLLRIHFRAIDALAMRYTAIEAVATDPRTTLFARNQAEPVLAYS